MNLLLLFLLVVTPTLGANSSETLAQLLVDYLNAAQDLFVAEPNDFSTKYPAMDAKFADPRPDQDVPEMSATLERLPAFFDSRLRWPHCDSIKLIRDQEHCGSCWAFAVAEVISDRTCIESAGRNNPILSPEDIVSCCGKQCGEGCHGGWPVEALKWWTWKGVVSGGDFGGSGCEPYSISPSSSSPLTPQCKMYCQKGYPSSYSADKHHGRSVYKVFPDVNAIKTEILNNGPVTATFTVFEDLYKYRRGIYHHVAGKQLGAHAVKIIGWGVEGRVPYWLIANSWGRGFGENGFMRFGMGECGIERNVLAGRARSSGEPVSASESSSEELQFM